MKKKINHAIPARNLKNRLLIGLVAFCLLFGFVCTAHSDSGSVPWVYPSTVTDPTTTSYHLVLLNAGDNQIALILWDHTNNQDFVNGKFIIAIKSGLEQVTINSITLTFDTQNLTGTSTPGQFPPGGIFPCPWKQYNVGVNLTQRQDSNGWQGSGDTSGIQITIGITVSGDPAGVKLYFLVWGFTTSHSYTYTDTPYSHITEASRPPEQYVPEVPLGPIMATISMVAAFGAYFGFKKHKIRLHP
jgi:hypothetical protein